MILRYEPWGAWVKLESMAAIVALDRDGVRALGLDGAIVWKDGHALHRAPVEVSLAVTSRCAVGCSGCYLDAKPDGAMPPKDVLVRALDALAEAGVFTVAFGGGEPTLRDDLGDLAQAARARGLTPVVTTSGQGLGMRKIAQLKEFAQVNVSYDGHRETYASVRGHDGSQAAERAIASLRAAGIIVGVNVVLTKGTWPKVRETVRRAVSLGASEVQLLRYKPQGRARSLEYLTKRLAPDQAMGLADLMRDLVSEHEGRAHVRIDCALVPFLSTDPTCMAQPEVLGRWGVLGCEAGGFLGAGRVDGRMAPCSFTAGMELAIEDVARGWADAKELRDYRTFETSPPEPCASCTLRDVCKGGCKVVSQHFEERVSPDPECPRVRTERSS